MLTIWDDSLGDSPSQKLICEYYDTVTGEKLSSSTLDLEDHVISFHSGILPLSDGRFLIHAYEEGSLFFLLDPEKGTKTDPANDFYTDTLTVAEGDTGKIAEYEPICDYHDITPGEVPENLADLKARVDALSEKYGIDIHISNECKQYLGGYLVFAENRRANIEEFLSVLEKELAKYPDDFFQTLLSGFYGPERFDLYLSGVIKGVGEYGTLEEAGGFALSAGDRYIIVLNIESSFSATPSFHHELSHIIEQRMLYYNDEPSLLTDEEWSKVCPDPALYPEPYTEDYAQFGNDTLQKLVYFSTDDENVYYIDGYSCTKATEDRARLLEHAMTYEDSYVRFKNCPHLLAKLNLYADAIEQVFGTPLIPAKLRVENWRELYLKD